MAHVSVRAVVVGLSLLAVLSNSPESRAAFTPGDVYAGSYNGRIYNITAGGDYTAAVPLVTVGSKDIGKAAFSADLSTMYVPDTLNNTVWAVTSAGVATAFATGLSGPMGVTRLADGRLMATEYSSGQITDISAGGNFTSAAPFASNLSNPGDITQTPDGRIFVTETFTGTVSNITAGGVITPAHIFASGLGQSYALIPTPASGLIVAGDGSNAVYTVSPTGVVATFATGRASWGITQTGTGQLLVADLVNEDVHDISAGGDMTPSPVFASNIVGVNSLWTVPVPEPATLALLVLAAPAVLGRRRRTH